ncbi:MAG: helix-turn-helix domain-containing protein [Clostridia bacterium]|nr:helix-turn-helix domain-containing protein [Clostridia bacterium]
MVGEKIVTYRRINGMSQQQLADAMDISRQTVVRWEKNTNIPSDRELNKLSSLLGISTEDLLSEETVEENNSETDTNVKELVNDISYGVSEQRRVLEEISDKQVTAEDLETLRSSFDNSKEHLEVQKAILHQKEVRNRILFAMAIVIIIFVGLLIYGIAFYANEYNHFTVYRPVEYGNND